MNTHTSAAHYVKRTITDLIKQTIHTANRVAVQSPKLQKSIRYLLGAIIGAILLYIAHQPRNHHTPDYTRQAQLIQSYRQMMQRDSRIIGLLLNEPHDRSKEIHKYTGKNLGQWYFIQEER